jgi:hypothetical protein
MPVVRLNTRINQTLQLDCAVLEEEEEGALGEFPFFKAGS